MQKITITGTDQAINCWASQAFMLTLKGGMLKKSLELPKTEELINTSGKDSDCSFHDFVSYLQFELCRLIQT